MEIPYRQHMLSKTLPTKFEIIFENNKDIFKLELELEKDKVLNEKLSIKTKRAFSKIYLMQGKLILAKN